MVIGYASMEDRADSRAEVLRTLRLAEKLGGAWRDDHRGMPMEGAMPLVVLTVPEAQAVEQRLGDEPEPLAVLLADLKLMESLALPLAAGANTLHDVTPVRQTARGYVFDVRVLRDGEPTGRVARVTVELGRIEDGAAPCAG